MKKKVVGADVAKDFLVLYDGRDYYLYYPDSSKRPRSVKKKLPKNATVKVIKDLSEVLDSNTILILEQTGTYGIRFAKLAFQLGAEVLVADGKALNRYRGKSDDKKTDYHDAKAIREMYFSPRRKNIHLFHPQRFQLRTMLRHYQRLQKEITRSVNRLKQQLVHLFPNKEYHNFTRYKLFKELPNIKKELYQSPESLSLVALSEIENLENMIKHSERLKEEFESIVKNHPDYEILKSFRLGLIQMVALIAYYWDISLFKNADDFVGYCLMGVRREQSGKSIDKVLTDKSRSEIKGAFYMFFMSSYRLSSPYKPLAEYWKLQESEHKRRFIKFADMLFRWIFKGLKERLTFPEVISQKIKEQQLQLEYIEPKIREAKHILYTQKLTKEQREAVQKYLDSLIIRGRNTSDLLLVCQDISTLLEKGREKGQGVESQGYYEESNQRLGGEIDLEQTGIYKALKRANEGGGSGSNKGNSGSLPKGLYSALRRRSVRKGQQDTDS